MLVDLTIQEIGFLNDILSKLTVNPAAGDAPFIVSMVHSIAGKINAPQLPAEPETPVETKKSKVKKLDAA